LRAFNEQRILRYLQRHPESSQLQVAEGVRLTRAAVAKLVGPHSAPPSNLRRVLEVIDGRPQTFALRRDLGCVMAVDIGSRHVRVRVADLRGRAIARCESEEAVGVARPPAVALETTARLMESALADSGYSIDGLAGVAIGVPFPVDPEGVIITESEWRFAQLPTALWERLPWATENAVVESDATLGALAELAAALRAPGLKLDPENCDLAYIKWSSLITAALVSHGDVHRGYRGMAGAFAHTPLEDPPDVAVCFCGRVCTNAVASLNAIVAAIPAKVAKELEPLSAEARAKELIVRARDGDEQIGAVLERAAHALGRAIGTLLNVMNPRLVVLGGAFHRAELSYLTPTLLRAVKETAFPPVLNDALIQSGRCTGQAAVDGGIELALREYAVTHLHALCRSDEPLEAVVAIDAV
jgi:predicted NBD/HSP70 family sugar kinase